jgi:hypothetical protein
MTGSIIGQLSLVLLVMAASFGGGFCLRIAIEEFRLRRHKEHVGHWPEQRR